MLLSRKRKLLCCWTTWPHVKLTRFSSNLFRVSLLVRPHHLKLKINFYTDRDFKLTFKLADDAGLLLSKYGEYLYQNLIIFAPSVEEFGGAISPESIAQFIDDGGNVLVAGSSQSGEGIRELASECGFEIDEENAAVIDHLNYDELLDTGDHTTIVSYPKNLINSEIIVGNKNIKPLLYRGTGILADRENPLVLPLLTADSTAYSYVPDQAIKEYPHAVGKGTILIAALQARNNARVVFSGSLFFFSDEALLAQVKKVNEATVHETSGNSNVINAISKWVFGESGQIRVKSVSHHKEGEKEAPAYYTILEPVVYTIEIEQLVDGVWKAFTANDVQLEFVRIDPFVRQTLKSVGGGKFQAKFKIPDVYGVYQFKVDYDRVGLTNLYSTTQVTINRTFSVIQIFNRFSTGFGTSTHTHSIRALHSQRLSLLRFVVLDDVWRVLVQLCILVLQGKARKV
jgi:oligosaccharyltransferase complex subunit beta